MERHGRARRIPPFQHGDVEVRGHARAIDPDYGQSVTVDETVTVRLKHD